MPGMDKIHLEDALEDSPQTRNMVALFEKDTQLLQDYVSTLYASCSKVLNAHSDLAKATSQLSSHLKAYKEQNFPLDTDPESILCSTLYQISTTLDEVSTFQQSCALQLGDSMMFPLNRFLEADLADIFTMSDKFHTSSADVKQALAKYCKLSHKKDSEKLRHELNEEVCLCNKKFHQTALHYYASLNSLQYKRRAALIEPMLGFLHTLRSHYALGNEALNTSDMENFLQDITASVQAVHTELSQETQAAVSQMETIEQQSCHRYYPEPPPELPFIPPNTSLATKSGYLFVRSKFAGMVTKWEQQYLYTVSGYLMAVNKEEIAGSVIMEIDHTVSAQALEHDDRRNVFQISNGKKVVVLQALNERERDEWIATIHNIAKNSLGQSHPRSKSSAGLRDKYQSGEKTSSSISSSSPDSGETEGGTRVPSIPSSNPSPPIGSFMSTPIQFDLISPQEESPKHEKSKDGPPARINPFDQSGSTIPAENAKLPGSLFWEVFAVRFLGSMEVPVDRGDKVVQETIRQVLAARAIHNIFRTTEAHLVVDDQALRIMDASHQTEKAYYNLRDISYWTFHKDNNRLLGFITCSPTNRTYHCHTFEAHVSAEEICSALSTAANIVLKTLLEKKNHQEKVENDSTTKQGEVDIPGDTSHLSTELKKASPKEENNNPQPK